jgi:ribosomal protein S18 acetylase RimI-like enzyme
MGDARHGLRVEPFGVEHVEAAGALLAARHRRDRARVAALPAVYGQPAVATELVRDGAAGPDVSGVIAWHEGNAAGFLIGDALRISPDSPIAPYYRPHSVLVRYHAHAAEPEGAFDIYRAMYAAVAGTWASAGLTAHYVHAAAGDSAVLDAFASLGCGRDMAWALRDTRPFPDVPDDFGLAIRRASVDDLDAIFTLDALLAHFESGSPVFMPFPTPLAVAEWRAELHSSLQDHAIDHWLAERDGVAIGLMTFTPPPRHVSPLLTPERATNISAASVAPEERSAGVGVALLQHGLARAREAGYTWCRLSYMTANLVSSRFWLRMGFEPVAWRLSRTVDDRAIMEASHALGRRRWVSV